MNSRPYIDYTKILTEREIESLHITLCDLSAFVGRVPVRLGTGDSARTMPVNLFPAFQSRLLPLELFALLKRFLRRVAADDTDKRHNTLAVVWNQICLGVNHNNLESLIALSLTPEPFGNAIIELVAGRQSRKNSFFDLFTPFREAEIGRPGSIFSTADPEVGAFLHGLREIRNTFGHGSRGINSDMIIDARRMLFLMFIWVLLRFSRELSEALISPDEWVTYSPDDITADRSLVENARFYGEVTAPGLNVDCARQLLRDRFAATSLSDCQRLAELLPRVGITGADISDGLNCIAADAGSGKTVYLCRRVIEGTIRPLTIRVENSMYRIVSRDFEGLARLFLGTSRMSLTPREEFARRLWLADAVDSHKVALVVDRDDSLKEYRRKFTGFIDSMPGLAIVCTTDQDVSATPLKESFNIIRLEPLSPESREKLMRLVSMHLNDGIDLSHDIKRRLAEPAKYIDMGHPVALMTLIDLVVRHTDTHISYTALIHRLMSEINARTDIDDDAKNILLGNALITEFVAERDRITSFAAEIYDIAYGEGPLQAIGKVEQSEWLSGQDKLQRLFEHAQLLADDDKVAALATMAANVVLRRNDGMKHLSVLIVNLLEIAFATASLPCTVPEAVSGDYVYRPEPSYMVSRLTMNMLWQFRSSKITVESNPVEVKQLMKLGAAVCTGPVLEILFSRYWINQWFYEAESDDMMVYMVSYLTNPKEFTMCMLRDYSAHIKVNAKTIRTRFYRLVEKLGETMSDFDIIGILDYIHDDGKLFSGFPDVRAQVANLLVLSMEVPSMADSYTATLKGMILNFDPLEQKLINYPSTRPLLLKLIEQAALNDDPMLQRLISVVKRVPAYQDDNFRSLISRLITSRVNAASVRRAMRSFPLLSMGYDLAMQVFDPAITDYMYRVLRDSEETPTVVKIKRYTDKTPSLLRPVTVWGAAGGKGKSERRNLYRFVHIGEDEKSTVMLATESVFPSATGLVVRLNGDDAFATVSDVKVPGISFPTCMMHIHVLSEKSVFPDIPARGVAKFIPAGDSPQEIQFDYIASMMSPGRHQLVLRSVAGTLDEWLGGKTRWSGAKVKIKGTLYTVRNIELFPLGDNISIVSVKPFGNRKRFDSMMDGEGTLSFNIRRGKAFTEVPMVIRNLSSRSPVGAIDNLLKLGIYEKDILLGYQGMRLTPGTLLVHRSSGVVLTVKECLSSVDDEMPPEYGKMLYMSRKRLQNSGVKPPFCNMIARVSVAGNDATKSPKWLTEPGEMLKDGLELKWYFPARAQEFDPELDNVEIKSPIFDLNVFPVHISKAPNGLYGFELPEHPDIMRVKNIRLWGIGTIFPVKRYQNSQVFVAGELLQPLLSQLHGKPVPLYVSLFTKNLEQLSLDMGNPALLLKSFDRHTASPEFVKHMLSLPIVDRDMYYSIFPMYAVYNRLDAWLAAGEIGGYADGSDGIRFRVGHVWECGKATVRGLDLSVPHNPADVVDEVTIFERTAEFVKGQLFLIVGKTACPVTPLMENYLRRHCLGGFRHGVLDKQGNKMAVIEGDRHLRANKSPAKPGDKVSYLETYQQTETIASYIKPL